jgi:multidrug efflux pump
MRVWIDPDRLASLGLAPGDVYEALQRNNYLAAVGQTKGNLVQVSLLANTDLRSTSEFENLIVADRGGAIVRLSDVARVELGAEEADLVAKYDCDEACTAASGPWSAPTRSTWPARRRAQDRTSASAAGQCGASCGTARCSCARRWRRSRRRSARRS